MPNIPAANFSRPASPPVHLSLPATPVKSSTAVGDGLGHARPIQREVTRLAFGTGSFSGQVSAISDKKGSRASSATPMITASASSKPPSPTPTCTPCWASLSKVFHATATG